MLEMTSPTMGLMILILVIGLWEMFDHGRNNKGWNDEEKDDAKHDENE